MSEQSNESVEEREATNSGSTSQDYGNLSVEDDAEGTVDPAELAGTGGPDDDGGPVNR